MLNLNNFFPFPGSFYDTIAVQTDKFNLKWIEENRANAKTEFFEQYSNDTRNNLTWEEQLEYTMDFSKQQKGVKSPIKLKGYKERGYSYAVYCGAHFNEDGILTDYQIFQRSYSDDFHDCKTDVRTIEGDKGTSPRYKFFYIMGYGRMPISIVWSEEKGAQVSVAEYYDKGERTLKPQWW